MTLFQYLLGMLAYSIEQKKHGHPGVVVTRTQAKEALGCCSNEQLDNAIYDLDNWSDYNKLPSLTCLFRLPVDYSQSIHYFDVHTEFNKSHNLMIQRHFLKLIPDAPVNRTPSWKLAIKEDLINDCPFKGEYRFTREFKKFERDLCEEVFGRAVKKDEYGFVTPSTTLKKLLS